MPLGKNLCLHPIGVGEFLRPIIARVIMKTFWSEIMDSAGNFQLCAGERVGCEAAVHAMKEIFDENECDAVLLIDADNAFNQGRIQTVAPVARATVEFPNLNFWKIMDCSKDPDSPYCLTLPLRSSVYLPRPLSAVHLVIRHVGLSNIDDFSDRIVIGYDSSCDTC